MLARGRRFFLARGRLGTVRVGVITIIEEEFEAAQDRLGLDVHVGRGYFSRGAPPRDMVLRRAADRTNVAATMAAKELIELFRPEVLLVLGIAGGIAGRGPALGDVVAADYLHYVEFRKLTGRGDLLRYIAFDQPSVPIRASCVEPTRVVANWVNNIGCPRPAEDGERSVAWIGSIAVAEKVMGDPDHEEQRRLVTTYNDALAIDMESYGVARAIHEAREAVDYDPLLVAIRGISDLVRVTDDEDIALVPDNNDERRAWKRYASLAAAAFAKEVISEILSRPDLREDDRINEAAGA
jgi:nucleoside phosphorylase